MKTLHNIQCALVAPKNERNNFGNYAYRTCEGILAALKPLLEAENAVVTLNDEVVAIGERIYVKATATLTSDEGTASTSAYAREAQTKKGMDESQITGMASSYARKYALCGLFAIDGGEDADAMDNRAQPPAKQAQKPDATPTSPLEQQWLNDIAGLENAAMVNDAVAQINALQLPPDAVRRLKTILNRRAQALHLAYNKEAARFEAAA